MDEEQQPIMKAKMYATSRTQFNNMNSEKLTFRAVSGSKPFGPNGESEDNTFARYTPDGMCELTITNPDLLGKIQLGQKFYLLFVPAPD